MGTAGNAFPGCQEIKMEAMTMITVSGTPFDPSPIINEYAHDSIERQLLDMMSADAKEHQYDSVNTLKFELRLRKEVVDAAVKLNDSSFSFARFEQSKCNPVYWDRTDNGGFMLRPGANAAQAIRDIFTNGDQYATECATAIVIVYGKALVEVLGENLFNQQFPQIYLMDWHSESILQDVIEEQDISNLLIGDGGYFSNPDFDPSTPEWQGENVIVLSGPMYYGHGIGIESASQIVRALNARRKSNPTRSAYLTTTVNRLNAKKLSNIYDHFTGQTAVLVWKPFPPPICPSAHVNLISTNPLTFT